MLKYLAILMLMTTAVKAQVISEKLNPEDYKNKSRAYAVLAAKYSKDAYRYAKAAFNANRTYEMNGYADTAYVLNEVSMLYADSAMNQAADSNMRGKEKMLIAKDGNNRSMQYIMKAKKQGSTEKMEEAMFAVGNALVDAYDASFYLIDRDQPADKSTKKRPMYEEDSLDAPVEEKEGRDVSRLESDEFNFVTLDHMFGSRIKEIDEEKYDLELKITEAVNPAEKKRLQAALEELEKEKAMLEEKKKKGSKRLVFLKQDLSKEMAAAVNSEIFTTNKEGFYSDEVPIPKDVDLPNQLVYKVQVGFFMNKIPPEQFDGIFPLSAQKVDDVYLRYMAGAFPTYEEANEAKQQVIDKGYEDAFVVAFYNDEKISIAEALSIEEERRKD